MCILFAGNTEETDDQRWSSGQIRKTDRCDSERLAERLHRLQVCNLGVGTVHSGKEGYFGYLAACRRAYHSSHSAWSKGWRPPDAVV